MAQDCGSHSRVKPNHAIENMTNYVRKLFTAYIFMTESIRTDSQSRKNCLFTGLAGKE